MRPARQRLKSTAQVRAEFERKGMAVAAWARLHGYKASLVRQILRGERKCVRGDSHRIAVLLGLKIGEIVEGQAAAGARA
jgi:gp16 family phage-associated protein